jgi:hypothetical protein
MKRLRGCLCNSKRAQMKLSFGMIFSIILILAFLAFSVYAIQKFLGIQRSIQIGAFGEDLQNDIDTMWRGSQGSEVEEYNLPGKIEKVCFMDVDKTAKGPDGLLYGDLKMAYFGSENMMFYPFGSGEGMDGKEIAHINLDKTTADYNPLCFDNDDKVRITLSMSPGDALVTISRPL